MTFLTFDIFKTNLCIFILFAFLKYTDQIKVTSTSGGTHDFRVSLDPSDSKRLLCFCRKGSGLYFLTNKDGYKDQAGFDFWIAIKQNIRQHQNQQQITKLEFQTCRLKIDKNLFYETELSYLTNIEELAFDDTGEIIVNERGLFTVGNTTVIFRNDNDFRLNYGTEIFNTNISKLIFQNLRINDFSSELFRGLSKASDVNITNCHLIRSTDQSNIQIKINSLFINNVTLDHSKSVRPFLRMSGLKVAKLSNIDWNFENYFKNRGIIFDKTSKLFVENSTLSRFRAISGDVKDVSFIRSMFLNPTDSAFSQFNASSISFLECNMSEFSSNIFLRVKGTETDVIFTRSILSVINNMNIELENVKLKSLSFDEVRFDKCKEDWNTTCPTYFQFLNVSAEEHIVFKECILSFKDLRYEQWGIDITDAKVVKFESTHALELRPQSMRLHSKSIVFENSTLTSIETGAIVITHSENVTFYKTILDDIQEEGIKATSDTLTVIDSVLVEPQRKALTALVPAENNSGLTITNLTLDNPARGALLTEFKYVNISRVNIDDPCKCDSVDDLTDDQNSFHTRFTSAVTKEELQAILVNQTYCRYHEENEKWRWVHPHEFCNLQGSAMKNRNIVIGFVFGFIIVGCAIVIGVTYKWHTKLQTHYSMIKRWSFHPPHDPEKVVINEDENKYFSFRFSRFKYFEMDDKNLDEGSNDEVMTPNTLQVPDLVLNLEDIEANNDEDNLDLDDQLVTPGRVFYRKPSKYVRPKLSLVEEEEDEDVVNATSVRDSGRGSMVINPSVRSSVRDSIVIHEETDSEEEYIHEINVL